MTPTKIMIIRHAEKPGPYGNQEYFGVDQFGNYDPDSLVTLGWQRAGALATLFCPTYGPVQNSELAAPNVIYAANPAPSGDPDASKRPLQTVMPLSAKAGISIVDGYPKASFAAMVQEVLSFDNPQQTSTVLISWQHQDILLKPATAKHPNPDSIVNELMKQTGTTNLRIPQNPWPDDRYDMVLVFDRPAGTGVFTNFSQVPQMLLAGDSTTQFS